MATQVQLRRGTTAEHSTFTGAVGELTVDTTKDTVVVHDGATAGGYPLAKETGNTTLDTTNLEVTNIKAKDGTAAMSIADSTGVVSFTNNVTLGNASTDTVTVNGYMGVGGSASGGISVYARNTALTSTSQVGFQSQITATSDATTGVYGMYIANSTEAAAFTVGNAYGVRVANLSLGSGSSATNQHGLHIADLTSATNNYGITSLVSSGTNKWNIYASGTAANYFAGNVGIGASSPSEKLHVVGGDVLIGTDSGSSFNGDAFLRIQGSNNAYIGIKAATNSATGLLFGDTDDSFVGGLQYQNSTDTLSFNAGNAERLSLSSTATVFNELGADTDFRVESDTNTHALFVDAGNSRVQTGGIFVNDTENAGGYAREQTITGSATAAASGTALKIVRCGHTGVFDIKIAAISPTGAGGGAGAYYNTTAIAYGGATNGTAIQHLTSGASTTITNINVAYDNSGSPNYTLNVTVTYTGSAPTIYWTVSGKGDPSYTLENLA